MSIGLPPKLLVLGLFLAITITGGGYYFFKSLLSNKIFPDSHRGIFFKQSSARVTFGPNEPLPSSWPSSLPINSDYLINAPRYFPDNVGGSVRLFSKRNSNNENGAFVQLVQVNGWRVTEDASVGMDSWVLIFEQENLKGVAEIYPTNNEPWLAVLAVRITEDEI